MPKNSKYAKLQLFFGGGNGQQLNLVANHVGEWWNESVNQICRDTTVWTRRTQVPKKQLQLENLAVLPDEGNREIQNLPWKLANEEFPSRKSQRLPKKFTPQEKGPKRMIPYQNNLFSPDHSTQSEEITQQIYPASPPCEWVRGRLCHFILTSHGCIHTIRLPYRIAV